MALSLAARPGIATSGLSMTPPNTAALSQAQPDQTYSPVGTPAAPPPPAPTNAGSYYAPGVIPPGATQPWDAPPLPPPPPPITGGSPNPAPGGGPDVDVVNGGHVYATDSNGNALDPATGQPRTADPYTDLSRLNYAGPSGTTPNVTTQAYAPPPMPMAAPQVNAPPPAPTGPVAMGPGGIPSMGQYVNPLFQQQQQTRDAQVSYLNQLQGDMQGNAPSLAQIQLKQGTDANIAGANALAASAGPNNYAAASRQAMNNAATQGLNLAGQTAALRAQEYASARDAYGQNINQLRGQDYSSTGMSYANAVQQAQLENQMNTTQANLQAGQNQLNLNGAQGYYNMGQAVNNTDLASRTHYLDLMAQKYANDRGIAATAANFNAQLAQQQNQYSTTRTDNLVNGAISGGAQWMKDVYSDPDLKTDIAPADPEELHEFLSSIDDAGPVKKTKPRWDPRTMRDFLGKLEASSFSYKDEKHGEGEHTGIMATDLLKSRIGKTLVKEGPEGKMIDSKRALSALLATGASHEKRISALEDASE